MSHTNIEMERVVQLQAGDEDAFAALYDDYAGLIFGIILRIVPDKAEAENLLQDCFVKVWQNIASFDPEKGRLATWLINIARNTAVDFTRSKYYSQKTVNQNLEKIVYAESPPFSSPIPVEVLGLRQLVKKLSPVFREVIEWMYFEGYTQQEIADRFNIPLGTVKTRSRQALKELKKYFCELENIS